jgi:hypothetical protein
MKIYASLAAAAAGCQTAIAFSKIPRFDSGRTAQQGAALGHTSYYALGARPLGPDHGETRMSFKTMLNLL